MPHKGYKQTPEHIRKGREARREYYDRIPPEVVERQRQSRLRYYQTHEVWNKGKPWSEEVKQHISEGRKRGPKRRSWKLSEQAKRNTSARLKEYYKTHNPWNKGKHNRRKNKEQE